MNEVIKYFESLEARIAGYEARIAALEQAQENYKAVIASLEAEIVALKTIPAPTPTVREVVIEKPIAEPEPIVESEPEVSEPVVGTEPEETVVESQESRAESQEEQASPKAAIYGKAVDDIRQAISLGDRFLYQRELFGQNAELMQRTLTEINELRSYEEAVNYISRFNWDTESNSYQQFIVTLHRRFG